MTEVRAGDVIAGKFQIERVLGEGGMGYVVAARHLQLGQMVALKFMREEVCNEEYKSRFLREARNTVRLKSKHVSRVLDVGALEGGVPYMVMEYLEGTDLSNMLHEKGPLPVNEACDYIIQACEAIAEAHQHGIVHRDLKPANLFLTKGSGGEPVVKVLDFGVSKIELNEAETNGGHQDSVVTRATDLLGSPSYMAPEQVVSARDADSRSDVWSLGVILFRLISGKAPFTGASLGDLIQNIMHGPMPNLRDLVPTLPDQFEYVIWRCLERERTRRPDVIELARMLSPYAGANAAPSLERIAILGPALVTAPSQHLHSSPSVFPAGPSRPSLPPGGQSRPSLVPGGASRPSIAPAGPKSASRASNSARRTVTPQKSASRSGPLLGLAAALACFGLAVVGILFGPRLFGHRTEPSPPPPLAATLEPPPQATPPPPPQTPEPPPPTTAAVPPPTTAAVQPPATASVRPPPTPSSRPTHVPTVHRPPRPPPVKPPSPAPAPAPTSDIPPTRE